VGAVASWELFAHDADVGVRGFGPTKEAAFEQGAIALMHAIGAGSDVAPKQMVSVACTAPDSEVLFVDWLNALIFEMATRSMLFSRFQVRIENGALRAEARGEPIDPARHEIAVEAKGATFTALKVAQGPDGTWVAQCVVDV
jgi:tRNA nucleotidyltransferase (CCA-adding enzyme)